jgi:hypothetical protein
VRENSRHHAVGPSGYWGRRGAGDHEAAHEAGLPKR